MEEVLKGYVLNVAAQMGFKNGQILKSKYMY